MLCTINVHFSFNGQFHLQKHGMAMRSQLRPAIARIPMAKLERNLLPMLSCYMTSWKSDTIDHILSILN